ncbi:MAG: ester cyclase [Acidobacteria bacterium]|jgi:predicted ester cyclase|nr:ester cyclase [Acidobacteriota bacterium]
MSRDEIIAFFDERKHGWSGRSPEALGHGHAELGSIESPMFGHRQGRAAIQESYRALFTTFPDWDFKGETLLIDGNRVAQPFSATATHVGAFMGLDGTNRRFVIQGVRLFDMADGLIQHERRTYDFTGLLIQIGILRGRPAKD